MIWWEAENPFLLQGAWWLQHLYGLLKASHHTVWKMCFLNFKHTMGLILPRFHIWSCNLSPWAQSHLLKQEPLLFPWKSPEGFVLSLRFTSQLGQWQYQHRWGLCCFVCLFDLKSPLYFGNNNQITNIHHLYKCQLLRCLPSDAGIICPMAIRTPRMTLSEISSWYWAMSKGGVIPRADGLASTADMTPDFPSSSQSFVPTKP